MNLRQMIEFGLTEEQRELRQLLKRFVKQEVIPTIPTFERQGLFPRPIIEGLAELGVLGALIPERYGGSGMDHATYGLVCEEVAYGDWVSASVISVLNSLVASAIMTVGSEEQRQRFLPPLCSGEKLAAACLTEPAGGSDLASIRTTARLDGDSYVIDGSKSFISHADQAGIFILLATVDRSLGRRGLTSFVVEAPASGLSTKPIHLVGLHRGNLCEVFFDEVRVPVENRLGEEGKGFRAISAALETGRFSVASRCIGQAQAALDLALDYAKEREAFGHPIGTFQMIQSKLADMITQIQAARLLVRQLGQMKDACVDSSAITASMAKLSASDTAMSVITEAIQIHGGYGLTEEYQVGRFLVENKVLQIGEGTNEIHRMLIAEHALGIRKSGRDRNGNGKKE